MHRAWHRHFVVLLVGLLVASGSALASARSEESNGARSFTSDWECEEAALVFHVDEAVLDPYVPDRFEMIVKGGKVQFGVFAEDCLVGVDGGEMSRTVLSGVTIEVANPDGSPGDGFAYDLHWGTDSATYFDVLDRLGSGDFIPGSTYVSTTSASLATDVTAEVNWAESPYTISAQVVETNPERVPYTSVHWVAADRGYTRSTYPHDIMISFGQGTLTTTPGTILYDILGAEQLTAPALFGRFTVEGALTDLVVDDHGGERNDSGEEFTIVNEDCRETGAFIAVDIERVQRHLPGGFSDHFALTTIGGKAVVGVVSIACREVSFDGREGMTWNTNEGIVLIEPPAACGATHNACEGFHHYLLWGPVDDSQLASRYDRVGALTRSLVPPHHNAVAIDLGAAMNSAEASLRGHYALTARTASAWVSTPDRKQTEWQIGTRGLVADSYEVSGPEFWSAGQITLNPEPGSPLADLLGSEGPFNTAGFITQLHGTDTVQLVAY